MTQTIPPRPFPNPAVVGRQQTSAGRAADTDERSAIEGRVQKDHVASCDARAVIPFRLADLQAPMTLLDADCDMSAIAHAHPRVAGARR